jgi:DNA-binding transcriptional LysR family regulator
MGIVDDLTILVEIIKAGGISAASRTTGISKSSLSRRISDLENQLGVHLLLRGPRKFSATEIGLLIFERGEKIKEELEAIKALVQDAADRPSGTLRISCPAVLTEILVADYACRFATEHPDVRLTLDTSVGAFDYSGIGQYDLSIQPVREDEMADSELIRQKLVTVGYRLVASPSLVQTLSPINSLDALSNCPGIGWAADRSLSRWRLINRLRETAELNVTLKFSANNLSVIRTAALHGLGMARLPITLCERDLSAGKLVLPLPDWQPPPITLYGLYPSRRALTFAGRLFLAGLARYLQDAFAT